MKKVKLGFIGVGDIAQSRHIPSFQALKEKVEIVGVHDVNVTRAQEVAKQFGIPYVYYQYDDLFPNVDAVVVCTPNKFHHEIAISALEANVHVLCEKPMAITYEKAQRMLQAAQKADRLLAIAYQYRFTEVAQLAKQAVLQYEIGEPLVTRIQAMRRRKVPGWGVFTNRELQGGGSLIDFGCHFLDLAIWLLGNPKPIEVMGKTYNRLSKTPHQINDWGPFDHETFDVDDHVSGYITFENNLSLLFECSWAANIKEDVKHLSISGDHGGLSVFPFELYQPKLGTLMNSISEAKADLIKAGMHQAENFIDTCLGTDELVVKPEEALKVTKMIDALYQSSEIGTSIILQ
ncbi:MULTISPECIES: Gfo/Idh/MocA family oxidoreductase [Clostridia]|uniref:Gfo/Idh/MocA family protein n=1 Tax=Clostridia TaxID=186801 RepID=UPI000EA27706|nr:MULTISPECIES: Gfo/Idh/MocA family oxidoreductase [Clostridia]NBJ68863.1 gfo/Idh/MocA family oxidoreductase [Roseburia sp. 1XD42-34]RKI80239.1 gfo/Idh/MocA family oxidoreductase [Clostridium sp. 1xD42-85]